ncbi:hypothetical protein Entas_0490 [Enterobacter soli]|nr:hypothetical protein Entas_0490 [Enterobacter soli]
MLSHARLKKSPESMILCANPLQRWFETWFTICTTPLLYLIDNAFRAILSPIPRIVNQVRAIRMFSQSFEFENILDIFSFSRFSYIK